MNIKRIYRVPRVTDSARVWAAFQELNKHQRVEDAVTSAELKQKLLAYGLNPEGKSMREMELMLGMAMFAESHPGEEFPDQFDPMLANDATSADGDWIDSIYNSSEWIIQEKKNGMRSILNLTPGKAPIATSRAVSVKNYLFPTHDSNVKFLQTLKNPFKGKTVLDGELMSPKTRIWTGAVWTASPLQAVVALVAMSPEDSLAIQDEIGSLKYEAYDILFYDGLNVQDLPYEERDDILQEAVNRIKEANPDAAMTKVDSIREYESAYKIFSEHIEQGKEGVMLKRKSAPYKQGYRSSDLMKLKGFVTVDGFITGSVPSTKGKGNENLIGGFVISAYVDGVQQVIANISNITNKIRTEATVLDADGKPTLNPEYLNKCVEIKGQEFGKNNKLGSARINEWRPDKNPEDCQLKADDVKPKEW